MRDLNCSHNEIARDVGRNRTTVSRIIKNYDKTSDLYSEKPRKGRPCKMDAEDDRFAAHLIHRSRARDATDLRNAYFPSLSTRTVELHLSNMGLPGRVRREKPWLSEKHVAERYQWAKDHLSCTEADWRRVVFSDESPFHLFPIRGREWCRRGPGEEFLARNLAPRLKHGGDGIQVWGCMTASGVGRLHLVQDHMDKFQYTAIIDDGLHDTLSDHHLTPSSIIFQQDNDPKHKSYYAMDWMIENDLPPMPWPANSPDMNIIEHLWAHLEKKLRSRTDKPSNIKQLFRFLEEEWLCIEQPVIDKLYSSMPRRVRALYDAKGGHTKY